MPLIPLTKGKFALVDDEDYLKYSEFKWCYANGYACRRVGKTTAYLHRLINNTPEGILTDHINQNRLDNRKSNLRTTDYKVNSLNCKVYKTNRTGVNGIQLLKKYNGKITKENIYRITLGNKTIGHSRDLSKAIEIRQKAVADILRL